MAMQRYRMTVAYRGTRYQGWQKQKVNETYKGLPPEEGKGIPTIQETLARALGEVLGHRVVVVGSSRTDAGVHAKGQVAHFDTDQCQIPPLGLCRAVNARLPDDIVIREIDPVDESFDAISCAVRKRYQYLIWNAVERPYLFPDLAWHRWQRLDLQAIAAAGAHFIGTHDFASFARPGHGRENTVRTVLDVQVHQRGPRLVLGVEGTGFLWNMIRIMVGTLMEVGTGRFTPEDIPRMLAARDRTAAGGTAPPHGLYLQWIILGETRPLLPPPAIERSGLPVAIRNYRTNHLRGIVEVADTLNGSFTEAQRARLAIDVRFASGYVATLGTELVGFISFVAVQGIARILWMGVKPQRQRQGIGKRLMERLENETRGAGITRLEVIIAAETSRGFFTALHFQTDENGAVMFKNLQQS